jgi:MFS family permease
MKQRSGLVVIVVVAVAYLIAVTQRATMGSAALDAADRFDTNAEQLSSLAVLQLIVYAAMQIPVGLLLDRFGARFCLTVGAFGMAGGQIIVAFSEELAPAVIGRMLVGLGDAFTFISMIRVVNGWYTGKKASLLQQWLGNLGQLGQVLSAFGFAKLLQETTWTFAFLTAASIGTLIGCLAWIVIRADREGRPEVHEPIRLDLAFKQLKISIREPSTRMAFFAHFCTQSASTFLLLLWGVPFLNKAEQVDRVLVSGLLSTMVFAGIAAGMWYGHICAHSPQYRRLTVLIGTSAVLLSFTVFVIAPVQLDFAWLAFFILIIGAVGPSSMIAFDYSKQYVPKSRLGATNGFINIGGFLSTFTIMFFVGVVLDVNHLAIGGELYSLQGFRFAFLSVIAVIGFGLWRFLVNESIVARQKTKD